MQKIGKPQNLIIDTDMGWDDVLAILLLMKNPNVRILGITVTGCGETHLEDGVYIARALLEMGNCDAVVCAGEAKPGSYDNRFPDSFREMMDDVCGLRSRMPEPKRPADSRTAWEFMGDVLNNEENQTTIISLGGLTNIVKLLDMDPAPKLENIERIAIMGGALYVDGNVAALNNSRADWDQGPVYASNRYAEWNIFLDPKAADRIFASSIPLQLIPLDACDYVILDDSYQELVTATDPVAQFMLELLKSKTSGSAKESIPLPVFDPLAALAGTDCLRNIRTEKLRIRVITEQTDYDNTCGKTEITHNGDRPLVNAVIQTSAIEFKDVFSDLANSPLTPVPDKIVNKSVGMFLFDQMEVQDFAGIFEVLAAARNSDGSAVFNVFTVANDGEEKRLNAGVAPTVGEESSFVLRPDHTIHDHPDIDILIIAGGQGIDTLVELQDREPEVINWIEKVADGAEYVASTCSGGLLLARTGLLKNMRVTTHHTRFKQLDAMGRDYNLNIEVVDTRNGENFVHDNSSKFMTSGGVHCGIALGVHLVELVQGNDKGEALAEDVLEYTIPRGRTRTPEGFPEPRHQDPADFILGFSHINVIVTDMKMMAEATEFYKKVLGFRQAWSTWLPEETCRHFAHDAGFEEAKVMVRFLVHPNAQIHIELMYYEYPKGNQEIEIHKTNDAGGIRHVAMEVTDAAAVYDWLSEQDGVKLLSKRPPEKLLPDPQTFFYWIDPFGVQWEMEQGRPVSRVISGITG